MKAKWSKAVPDGEGWWWIKYKGKKGTVTCPCSIMRFETLGFIVNTARNDMFASHSPQEFVKYNVRFGPPIPYPE